MDIHFQVYQVRYWRQGRGWVEEERFLRQVRLIERPDGGAALVPVGGRPGQWRPLGSLAVDAFRSWQVAAQTKELPPSVREAARKRADLVRAIIAGQSLSPGLRDALSEVIQARVRELPEELVTFQDSTRDGKGRRRHAVTMQRALGSREPVSVPAVYFSVQNGRRAKLLYTCTRCNDPFVAWNSERRRPDRRRKTCDVCRRVGELDDEHKEVVRRVLARVRGHYRGKDADGKWQMTAEARARFASHRRQLREGLLRMPFAEWEKKHDPPRARGPGRPRKERRSLTSHPRTRVK